MRTQELQSGLGYTSASISFRPADPKGLQGEACVLMVTPGESPVPAAVPVGAGQAQGCLEVAKHGRLPSPLPAELLPTFCKRE